MESITRQEGHNDVLFLSEVPEFLRCSICLLVLNDPVQIIKCGHKLCEVCFRRTSDHAQSTGTEMLCPIDREVVDMNDVRPDVAMKRVIGSLSVRCPEHESGCSWTGELSEMEVHHSKCKHRKQDQKTLSVSEDMVRKLNERLDRFEVLLNEKDKEVASLRYNFSIEKEQRLGENRQLQQLCQHLKTRNDEMAAEIAELLTIQQHQASLSSDLKLLKEKNNTMEEEISQLRQERQQVQSIFKDLGVEIMQDVKKEVVTACVNLVKEYTIDASGNVSLRSNNSTDLSKNQTALKSIAVQHHSGPRESITISDDYHRVNFCDFSTVSAPSAQVPNGSKVWYEVHILPCVAYKYLQIGWATSNLPTLECHVWKGVGDDKDSYGFDPFAGQKWHGGPTAWGRKLKCEKGGHIGVALDTGSGQIMFSVDGYWRKSNGVAFTGIDKSTKLFPALSGEKVTVEINFGNKEFKYGPPAPDFKNLIEVL